MLKTLEKIHWQEQALPSSDKVLLLTARGEEKPQENKLRAKCDASLWFCSFEKGHIPEALKQKWTKYSLLVKAVTDYYAKKKIEVKEE